MKLSQLAAKPQLIEITIDDKDTVEKYGEAVSFWIYDRHDIETFAKMATVDPDDFSKAAGVVSGLIMDDKGQLICGKGQELPIDIMMKAVTKVIDELGKSVNSTSGKVTDSSK